MEKGPKISPEEQEAKHEKAEEDLEEAFEKSEDSSEEEREKELFSIPGVEKGRDWEKMKEHLRKKQE